jgi:hypothetical protein
MAAPQTPPPDAPPSPAVEARVRALEEYFAAQPTPKPIVSSIQTPDPGSRAARPVALDGGSLVHVNPLWLTTGVLLALALLYLAARRFLPPRA